MALYYSIGAALNDDMTGTEPVDWRKTLAGLVTGPGVLPGASSPLVEGVVGAMRYQVNAATWATPEGASGGVHLWGNDGPITVATDAAPGSGLQRIDIVYALHTSNGEGGATVSAPVVDVEIGTPASSPTAPVIPTGAIELGRNTMTSTATDTAGSGNSIAQTASAAHIVGTVNSSPNWTTIPSGVAVSGFTNNSRLMIRDRWVTVIINLVRGASAWGGGSIDPVIGPNATRAHTAGALYFAGITSEGAAFRARVYSDGQVAIYSAPGLPAGGSLYGTVSYPV